MTDNLASKAREIYLQLSTLDTNALEAELDRLVGSDARLKDAVVSLIDAQARADRDEFMSNPTASTTAMSATITESAGSVIGRYKLLQLIGEGGFGSVFLAEQTKPVRRRVALKIIKLGMDTKQVIARFEAERQALAMMDHPNIARVYDAGATETGRPYFAMEYVVGDAITKFADAHKLDIPARLALFSQVCSAVQHAHTKGVIHRDLKPANVLVSTVDGKPFAKVIDFGIAKATASPLTEITLFTEHRQLIGTPEYMSPEQAEGSPDIDTRTDVYALGVLLYELLTGVTPFDAKRLRSAAYGEMQRIIKEEDPPAPSLRLTRNLESLAQTAMARQVEPAKLSTAVRGELDWIVMKALDKDRGRRYESAALVAKDIGNHLAGEAVVAAPPSRGYRVRKFVRRNKGAVIATTTVCCVFLIGLISTIAALRVAHFNAKAAIHNAELATAARDELQASNAKLEAQAVQAQAGAGQMLGILSDGQFGGGQPDSLDPETGVSEFETDPLGATIGMGIQMAVSLKEERDRLQWRSDVANSYLSRLMGETWGDPDPKETFNLRTNDGQLATLRYEVRKDDMGNRVIVPVILSTRAYDESTDGDKLSIDGYGLVQLGEMAIAHLDTLREERDRSLWSAYTANLALAQLAMDAGNYPEARKRLAECPEGKRGWEWTLANLRCYAVTSRIKLANDWIFSPTDSRLATFSADIYTGEQDTLVFENTDFETPVVLGRVGPWNVMQSARWSPDGERILLISSDGGLQFFNADGTGEPRVQSDSAHIREAEWNSDGSRLLTVSNEGVHVRQPDGMGKQLITLNEDPKTIRHAAWHPHNNTVAVLYSNGRIDTIDPDTHEAKTICPASGTYGWSMKWSPDGSRIVAYASLAGTPILLVNTDSSEPDVFRLAQPAAAICANWSPDGSEVVVGFSDRTATIIDASNSSTRHLKGMHSWGIFDVAWSNDGETVYTSSFNGICAWDPSACMPLGFITNGSEHPWHITAIPNSQSLIARNRYAENEEPATLVIPSEVWNTPDQSIRQNLVDMPYHLYVDAIASSTTQDPLTGLNLLTPDGTRRIEAQGRTLRFYDQSTGREVSTYGFDETITNLVMTGDGSRLVIEQTKTAPRVWDTRTQEEQVNDIQARWRERVPAGEYLDKIWNSQTSSDALMDEIVADHSLTPLRKLVAAEMLGERLTEMRGRASQVMNQIRADKTNKQDVLDEAARAEVHPRVREALMSLAHEWEYIPPKGGVDAEQPTNDQIKSNGE
ncbi:MAG: protein kinase [Phycisphaerales bacterium JB058]